MPCMTRLFLGFAVILLVAPLAACTELGSMTERPSRAQLDGLFHQLKTAGSPEEAERLEVAILGVLGHSGVSEVDRLTVDGMDALNDGDLELALERFDQVVRRAPRFVEGWNLRATVFWMRDDYDRAIADLRHVLVLEPRHFGAMTLLGRIFADLDQPQAALAMLEKALQINPHLDNARQQAELLRDQVAGVPI